MPANSIGFINWLLIKEDSLEAIVILYKSRINPDSPRFIPLFENSKVTRVVLFHGARVPKSDRLMLVIFDFCKRIFSYKIRRYKWCHVMATSNSLQTNQVLHIDDPTYSPLELHDIKTWNHRMKKLQLKRILIVTNDFSKMYFTNNFPDLKVEIIEQGFTEIELNGVKKNSKFSCVYSSPFIDYGSDLHSNHSAWGSRVLIDEIIPKLLESDPQVEVHLVGSLGKDARTAVSQFSNVIYYGYVNRYENARILRNCHVSIYPRVHDHFRAVQKIGEYIGASNPIVAFKLVDTAIVSEMALGIVVDNSDEFVQAILSLRVEEKYNYFKENVNNVRPQFSWEKLAFKLDSIILM